MQVEIFASKVAISMYQVKLFDSKVALTKEYKYTTVLFNISRFTVQSSCFIQKLHCSTCTDTSRAVWFKSNTLLKV